MKNQHEILQLAQQRGVEHNLLYAGVMSPHEAFVVLQADAQALLIDVRSKAELELVGRIPTALNVEWMFYPGMLPNHDFSKQLIELVDNNNQDDSQQDRSQVLIFMCRTGGRSHSAAAAAAALGFSQAYNMLDGFEGELNSEQQRTMINGWRHAGLPWTHAKK